MVRSGQLTAETRDVIESYQALGFICAAADDILAFEENRHFTVMLARLSGSDSPQEALQGAELHSGWWVRRLIFLKPSTFLVDDHYRLTGVKKPLWDAFRLLESSGRPKVEAKRVTITQEGYRLTCETLLPDKAKVRAAPEELPPPGQPIFLVRILPDTGVQEVRFLHVMHLCPAADAKPGARAEVSQKDGQIHLKVSTADRIFQLTLPPWKVGAGDIAIADAGGKSLLDRRPLPSGVLPHTPEGIRMVEGWDSAYRGGRKPAWDTGRPASDLVKAVEEGKLGKGRAVELGCGTGTNAIYLAQKGFDVTAIDIAPTAIALAQEKARKAGVKVRFLLADVLAPPRLEPFDLIFDRGCYHGVRGSNAAGYVETVRRLSHPGTLLVILAGNANQERSGGPPRVSEEQFCGDVAQSFAVVELRETHFDGADPAAKGALAWFALLRRKGEPH